VLILREADRQLSFGHLMVRLVNRTKAILQGRWRQPLVFRSLAEWRDAVTACGLDVESAPASRGTPFANVLVVGRKQPKGTVPFQQSPFSAPGRSFRS
jgi:hypothetical protein